MTGTAQRHAPGCPDGPGSPSAPIGANGPDVAGLTALMDMIFAVWDHLENTGGMNNEAGDMFECIIGHIGRMLGFDGWGGIAEKFLR